MTIYKFVKNVNLDQLKDEINSSSLKSTITSVQINGTVISVTCNVELNEVQSNQLRDIIIKHNASSQIVEDKVVSAMDYGRQLIIQFASRNIMAGLTEAQILQLVLQLKDIQMLLLSGSLKTALTAIQMIKPSVILPQSVLDEFAQKLKTYLGIS